MGGFGQLQGEEGGFCRNHWDDPSRDVEMEAKNAIREAHNDDDCYSRKVRRLHESYRQGLFKLNNMGSS